MSDEVIPLGVSNITTVLLEKIRVEMSQIIGRDINLSECIAFILEDYTKSFYQRLLDG